MLKLLIFLIPMTWAAVQVDLAKQTSEVEFFAVGKPSLLKINGTGGKIVGNLELDGNQIKGRFKVKLDAFTTGIPMRDQHMKEKYLETAKFSEATLEVEKINLPENFIKEKKVFSDIPFEGKLSLHGVEKSVKGVAEVDTKKEVASVTTEFKILVSDFNIEIPSYLGIKVADQVTIKTKLNLDLTNQ